MSSGGRAVESPPREVDLLCWGRINYLPWVIYGYEINSQISSPDLAVLYVVSTPAEETQLDHAMIPCKSEAGGGGGLCEMGPRRIPINGTEKCVVDINPASCGSVTRMFGQQRRFTWPIELNNHQMVDQQKEPQSLGDYEVSG